MSEIHRGYFINGRDPEWFIHGEESKIISTQPTLEAALKFIDELKRKQSKG